MSLGFFQRIFFLVSIVFLSGILSAQDTVANGKTRTAVSKFIPVKCTVINSAKGTNIDFAPSITEEAKGKHLSVKPLSIAGTFEFLIEKTKNYKIECNVIGYKNFDNTITIFKYLKGEENEFEIRLIPLKAGDFFTLKKIYFYPNTPMFMNKSNKQLEELYTFMKSHPEAKISIEGHTNSNRYIWGDNKNSQQGGKWNFRGTARKLSRYRATEVKSYLVKHGIDAIRIETKGYGGNREIYPDAKNLQESLMNMRVEVFIIKI